MRRSFLVLIVLGIAFGCNKDALPNAIVGTWELRESLGGWTGITYYKAGNGNLVTFDDNGNCTYQYKSKDTAYTLRYKYYFIKPDECTPNLSLKNSKDDYVEKQSATVSHDTLTLSDGHCIADGDFFFYVRKR